MPLSSLRRAVAVAAALVFAAACSDEFSVDPPDGFTAHLETADWPDALIVGDTVTLHVEVHDDATGALVDPQEIDWTVQPANALDLIASDGDSVRFRVAQLGSIQLRATLDDPAFDTASVVVTLPSVLGGLVVEAPENDTLRSLGDETVVRVRGLDANGNEFVTAGYSWTLHGSAVATLGSLSLDSVRVVSTANGSAWVVASHAQCEPAEECRDSVLVGVQQEAAAIALSADSIRLEALTATGLLGVTVTDANGNAIDGAAGITWESSEPSLVGVAPNPSNAAQATVTAAANGASIVRARLGDLVDEATVRVAQRATQVVAIAGDDQLGAVATLLSDSLRVEARDALGFSVAGAPIAWSIVAGSGSITGATTTGANGRAGAAWTLGTQSGEQAAAGLIVGVDTATFSAAASAGPAASVAVTPDTTQFASLGQSSTLTVTVKDAFGNTRSDAVVWTTLTPTVASVSSSGAVTAVANGIALVEARAGTAADTAVVNVSQLADSIEISVDSLRFASLGASTAVTATVRDAGGSVMVDPTGIVWEVTSSSVITVAALESDSTQATVSAIGNGATFLRARLNGFSDQIPVTVQQVVTSAVLVSGGNQLALVGALLGDSLVVEARDALGAPVAGVTVTWAVLAGGGSVSGNGVTGANGRASVAWTLGALLGTQRVRATIAGADPVVFEATALAGTPTSITITPSSATLTHVDDTAHLAATVRDIVGNLLPVTVTWSSTNEAVATVSASGVVVAVGNGSAQIVASAGSLADTITVTVQQLVASITLAPGADTLSVGDTLRIVATARDSGGTVIVGAPITWTSTVPGVAEVNASGRVTALALGSAGIRATSSGVVATAPITVVSWALSFDGDDFAEVPNAAAFEPDADSTFSVEVWVRPDSTNGGALLAVWSSSRLASSWALRLNGLVPQLLLREPTGNAFTTLSAVAPLTEDAWQHVAFTFDHGRVNLYVNGVLAATDSVAFLPNNPDATGVLRFGADATGSSGAPGALLNGDLDEIRLWSSARTQPEITAHMNARVAGQSGLRAYWPLYLGAGNPVDLVGGLIAVRGGATGGAAMPSWITDGSPTP